MWRLIYPSLNGPGGFRRARAKPGTSGTLLSVRRRWKWVAVQGLRRYGYQAEADRIATKFVSLVLREYAKHGVIVEKYDVVRARADVGREIRFVYTTNEAGFGWSNAVFTALFDGLPARGQEAVRAMDAGVIPVGRSLSSRGD